MIEITMSFKGDVTTCAAAFVKGDEVKTIYTTKPTGAEALNLIVGRLSRARLGGQQWSVPGTGLGGGDPRVSVPTPADGRGVRPVAGGRAW